MTTRNKILFSFGFLLLASGVYYWGLFMQEQAELDLERVRVENQRELALLEEVQKKKVLAEKALVKAAEAKLRVEVLPDNQDAVKSKYRFPSMRKVRAGLAIDLNKYTFNIDTHRAGII